MSTPVPHYCATIRAYEPTVPLEDLQAMLQKRQGVSVTHTSTSLTVHLPAVTDEDVHAGKRWVRTCCSLLGLENDVSIAHHWPGVESCGYSHR